MNLFALKLLLFAITLVITLVSLAVYASRRHANKHAFSDLKRTQQPVRRMTPQERAAVQPFLVHPLRRNKVERLEGDGVYRLGGAYLRHGLHTSQGGQTMHDTLGGVDVVLPYDARDFLQADNTAEVVLAGGFAIVIRLNDGFDLQGGRERSLRGQELERQWQAGETGALPETDAAGNGPAQDVGEVRVLGQRPETPAEIAARKTPGLGWLPAVLLVAAFALLLAAGRPDASWLWLVPAAVLFAGAVWLALFPSRGGTPQKINRVEGGLSLIRIQDPGNSSLERQQLFLGDRLPLSLPAHWARWIDIPAGSRVDLDVRVHDHSVVRFGESLSLDREERLFPSVFWGRHLVLALAGAGLLLAAALINDTPRDDLDHVRAALEPSAPALTRPEAVLAGPPAPGRLVHVRGSARCRIAPAEGVAPAPLDCRTLRWGGADARVEDVKLDAQLLRLKNGELVAVRENAMMGAVVAMQRAMMGIPPDPYSPAPSIYDIERFPDLVLAIDGYCKGNHYELQLACRTVQTQLGKTAGPDDDSAWLVPAGDETEPGIGWAKLLELARRGDLARSERPIFIQSQGLAELRNGLRAIAAVHEQRAYAPALARALASQRGGVLLPLPGDAAASTESDASASPDPAAVDWSKQWERYQEVNRSHRLVPVDLQGLVVRRERAGNGDLLLEIDPSRNRGNAFHAALRLTALALAAAVLLLHAGLCVRNLRRASRRAKALEAHLQQNAMRRF